MFLLRLFFVVVVRFIQHLENKNALGAGPRHKMLGASSVVDILCFFLICLSPLSSIFLE
jgi:hypothetical protein